MADSDVLIPLAIILALALMMGGGSGQTEKQRVPPSPQTPSLKAGFHPYSKYQAPDLVQGFGGFGGGAVGSKAGGRKAGSVTDDRFERDQDLWRSKPNRGRMFVDTIRKSVSEITQSIAAIGLNVNKSRELQNPESIEALIRSMDGYTTRYRSGPTLADRYTGEIVKMVSYIEDNLDLATWSFARGEESMTQQERQQLLKDLLTLKHECADIEQQAENMLYEGRTLVTQLKATEKPITFDDKTSEYSVQPGYVATIKNEALFVPHTPDHPPPKANLKPLVSQEDNILHLPPIPSRSVPAPVQRRTKPQIMKPSETVFAEGPVTPKGKPPQTRRNPSPNILRLAKSSAAIAARGGFNQAPATPTLVSDDDDASVQEDQLSSYADSLFSVDAEDYLEDETTPDATKRIRSFLDETKSRGIDTQVVRDILNQAKKERDPATLKKLKKNLFAAQRNMYEKITRSPAVKRAPWRTGLGAFQTPYKVAGFEITSSLTFRDSVRKSKRAMDEAFKNKNSDQINVRLKALKSSAPRGWDDGSWWTAFTNQSDAVASNGKKIKFRDLNADSSFRYYLDVIRSGENQLDELTS